MTLNENQTRKQLIDGQISKAGWNITDITQVRFEVPVSGDDPVLSHAICSRKSKPTGAKSGETKTRSPSTVTLKFTSIPSRRERTALWELVGVVLV